MDDEIRRLYGQLSQDLADWDLRQTLASRLRASEQWSDANAVLLAPVDGLSLSELPESFDREYPPPSLTIAEYVNLVIFENNKRTNYNLWCRIDSQYSPTGIDHLARLHRITGLSLAIKPFITHHLDDTPPTLNHLRYEWRVSNTEQNRDKIWRLMYYLHDNIVLPED